ncbi:MAG: peroxiredoxin [Microbacteriaceae bacterium]|jgi:organic hydroperoxide reductase OsmC/OhrA|nr:peroxiredoxin [Microbacteriaceae bacterium]HEV7955752.1 OsmC family protein [Marisediminicola sp.]
MNLEHNYSVSLEWLGNRGTGTSGYRDYGREHAISGEGKPPISGSSDRVFHGNADRWNPEELLLSALSQCHLLSYLHVASSHGIIVTSYTDNPVGTMKQSTDGGGRFVSVTLRPVVTVADDAMVDAAHHLHAEASTKCFIAASVNFPVHYESSTIVAES